MKSPIAAFQTVPAGSRRYCRLGTCATTAAFSLIEVLVTVMLLSFIILGLLAMFNQTQRAFRGSMNQVDVLEGGRVVTEMIMRELEQMTPTHQPDFGNVNQLSRCTNFFAELNPGFAEPQLLGLPGTTWGGNANTQDRRTNIVERFFFVTKINQDWVGTGYLVVPDTAAGMVGTLYRYSVNHRPRLAAIRMSEWFELACQRALLDAANNLPVTNMNRIADGIVHLQLRAYDRHGLLINPFWPDANAPQVRPNFASRWMSFAQGTAPTSDQVNVYFMSNAVPATVELELGIVEPQILQRFKSIGAAVAQRNYLSNYAGQVHVFRQRVPIRNVDNSVF